MKKLFLIILLNLFFVSGCFAVATPAKNPHPHLQPITWQGAKWEYLVEFPKDIQHIDVARFETLTDNVGQHGWELVEVTSEFNMYVFYFKRPLLEHKINAHRDRLNALVAARKAKEAAVQAKIDKAFHQKPAKK